MNRKLDQPEQPCTADTVPTSAATTLFSGDLPVDQIICGDNCDVLGTFPRDCIDLVVTSPPYDDLRTYGGHDWDFYGVAWQLKRVLKPGGVIVWVVADQTKDGSETTTSFRQALFFREIGFNLETMIYENDATGAKGSNDYYWQAFEFMFVLAKGKPKTVNRIRDRENNYAGEKTRPSRKQRNGQPGAVRPLRIADNGFRTNIWRFHSGHSGPEAFSHPAPFPEDLATDHIRSWSNEGDIVLDPFNGSGTTCKAARELGRRYIGIDVNEEYCEIARKRIAQKLLWE